MSDVPLSIALINRRKSGDSLRPTQSLRFCEDRSPLPISLIRYNPANIIRLRGFQGTTPMNQQGSQLCRCDGWWEQEWYGRQSMENLRIAFEEGRIRGSGSDIVGPFTLSGILGAGGTVVIQKQYLHQHRVEYTGAFDGEGVMSGQWRIVRFHGPWMIRIRSLESEGALEISDFVPGPSDNHSPRPSTRPTRSA